jgi:RNAse (barnase) inhibitor barstar
VPTATVDKQLHEGGAVYAAACTADDLRQAAQAAGYGFHAVECTRAKTKSALLNAIENALDFPEHFGHNLDALYDCLTDLVLEQDKGLVLVLKGLHEEDEQQVVQHKAVTQVFEDVIEFARDNGKAMSMWVTEG